MICPVLNQTSLHASCELPQQNLSFDTFVESKRFKFASENILFDLELAYAVNEESETMFLLFIYHTKVFFPCF